VQCVPLTPEALVVLDEARPCSDGTADSLVFPSARSRQGCHQHSAAIDYTRIVECGCSVQFN